MAMTLRAASLACGLPVGAAVDPYLLDKDGLYAATVAGQFAMVTPENVMKACFIQPGCGRFDFGPADVVVDFAERHGMSVRGHVLVWHNQLPCWLSEGAWSARGWREQLERHIRGVAGHFHGRVACWDVVNEAVGEDGGLRDSPWLKGIGPSYLGLAFRIAHEVDPGARLFYNDWGSEGLGGKSDAVYFLMEKLLSEGVPVHGVGLEMHIAVDAPPPWDGLAAQIERLGSLGLEVQITELDVRLRQPAGAEAFEQQAKVCVDLLDVCLATAHCTALALWGVTDRYSWVPEFFPGWGQALIFDGEYRPKPAFHAMLRRLEQGRAQGG